jgi:hypothetical protein
MHTSEMSKLWQNLSMFQYVDCDKFDRFDKF